MPTESELAVLEAELSEAEADKTGLYIIKGNVENSLTAVCDYVTNKQTEIEGCAWSINNGGGGYLVEGDTHQSYADYRAEKAAERSLVDKENCKQSICDVIVKLLSLNIQMTADQLKDIRKAFKAEKEAGAIIE